MSEQETLPLDQFSYVDHPGQYDVTAEIRARVRLTVAADSPAGATLKIEDEIMADGYDLMPDEIIVVEGGPSRPKPRMYRVIRDGEPMQVSQIAPGDLPRSPNERGF